MPFQPIIALQELETGQMRGMELSGTRVLLLRLKAGVFAYEDRCPHRGIPLSEGTFQRGVVTCRAHRYEFDAATGEGIEPPCVRMTPIPSQLNEGMVWVDVPATSSGVTPSG